MILAFNFRNINNIISRQTSRRFIYSLENNNPEIINQLISKLDHFANSDQAIKTLLNFRKEVNGMKFDPRYGIFKYSNCYIVPGFKAKDTRFIENLKKIRELGCCKTSAPELLFDGRSLDKKFDVIIYRINGSKDGQLKPLKSLNEIPQENKQKFINEQMDLLQQTSLFNRAVTDSYDDWFVTRDSKNIHIASWSNLDTCPPHRQKEIEKILTSRCNRC